MLGRSRCSDGPNFTTGTHAILAHQLAVDTEGTDGLTVKSKGDLNQIPACENRPVRG